MLSPEVIILDKEVFIGERKALGYSGHLSVVTVVMVYEHNATMIYLISPVSKWVKPEVWIKVLLNWIDQSLESKCWN